MITEIYEFWFLGPKMAVSWRISAFQKKGPETPVFIVFWGARCLGQGVKKGKFWKATQQKRKSWLITEKLFFGIFAVILGAFFSCNFLFPFFVFFFLEGLRVRWGGPKGHLTWP